MQKIEISEDVLAQMTPTQRAIVERLQIGDVVSVSELVALGSAHFRCLRVQICRANAKLRPHGKHIRSIYRKGYELAENGAKARLSGAEAVFMATMQAANGDPVPRARLANLFPCKDPSNYVSVLICRLRHKAPEIKIVPEEGGQAFRLETPKLAVAA